MDKNALIKKLRQLKKQEQLIRFSDRPQRPHQTLVWASFFSTQVTDDSVSYDLGKLLKMTSEERKETFEAFFWHVTYVYYKENGLSLTSLFDKDLLARFGLPITATAEDVKVKFRKLVMINHPDKGGEASKLIEIIEAYEALKSQF